MGTSGAEGLGLRRGRRPPPPPPPEKPSCGLWDPSAPGACSLSSVAIGEIIVGIRIKLSQKKLVRIVGSADYCNLEKS